MLGSLWFFSDASIVPKYFGLADGNSWYFVKEHYTFYVMHAHLYLLNDEPYSQNYFPAMKSNNTPAPFVASASSVYAYAAYYEPWCSFAFNGQGWRSAYAPPQWIQLKADGLYRIKSYTLGCNGGTWDFDVPYAWTLSGSIDGVMWKLIDTVTNSGLAYHTTYQQYYVPDWSNNSFFTYFRFNITRTAHFTCIYNIVFTSEKYQDKVNEFDNNIFWLKDLQYLAPPGFKTYIYIGN